ncbi:MAG TPA: hypothetical protein VGI14_12795 [Casimicrobiaceae bacterium]|jgi:hypothetical protein
MRKPFKPLVLAALTAMAAAGPSFADDNGMTAGYGDSWANLQAQQPHGSTVPGLAEQEDSAAARASWAQMRDDVRAGTQRMRDATANTYHRMTGTGYATSSGAAVSSDTTTTATTGSAAAPLANPPQSQAAPAAYSGQTVAPGPAAVDAGATSTGAVRSIPDRGGPMSPSGSSTNTVDPTGVGAATMGGSPYGGNQDPAKLPSQTSTQ